MNDKKRTKRVRIMIRNYSSIIELPYAYRDAFATNPLPLTAGEEMASIGRMVHGVNHPNMETSVGELSS